MEEMEHVNDWSSTTKAWFCLFKDPQTSLIYSHAGISLAKNNPQSNSQMITEWLYNKNPRGAHALETTPSGSRCKSFSTLTSNFCITI